MADPGDEALLRSVAGGDESAFSALYRRHTPRLYAVVLRMLAQPADAEDAVQETWLRAVRGLSGFRGDSLFATWLTGIGVRCALESLRRRGPLMPAELAEPSAAPPARHLAIDLERAVAALPDGYRAVLVLHDIEGFTHQEIADLLGVDPGTSKSQLFHARRALRGRL